jgi:hypothetical protein
VSARATVELPEDGKWIEQVASATGLSVNLLQQLVDLADIGAFEGTSVEVINALLEWLATKPITLMELVRPESLEGLFGDKYKKLPSDEERASLALAAVTQLLPLWMAGVPLRELEEAFPGRKGRREKCEYARHFVLRVVPDLAFLADLPARLLTARGQSVGAKTPRLRTVLTTLGSAVREGCDSPEALATRINWGRSTSRVAARQIYESIRVHASAGDPTEDFEETRHRIRDAEALSSLITRD